MSQNIESLPSFPDRNLAETAYRRRCVRGTKMTCFHEAHLAPIRHPSHLKASNKHGYRFGARTSRGDFSGQEFTMMIQKESATVGHTVLDPNHSTRRISDQVRLSKFSSQISPPSRLVISSCRRTASKAQTCLE